MMALIQDQIEQVNGAGAAASNNLHQRTRALLQAEIDFIPNPSFQCEPSCDQLVDVTLSAERSAKVPTDLPPHLRRLCETNLLTHEQESALFREMNLLKYQASKFRAQLDCDHPELQLVETIEALLARAQVIRDHIIQSNMRLVMSIVKKFVTPQQSFDEMLSEGIMTLMQTVQKFDFDRGFRFSTYAYRSIARNAYRTVTSAQKEEARYTRDAETWAFEQQEEFSSSRRDQVWSNLRELAASMLDDLDRRERFIIRSRYALGAHRKVRTFQFLADKLGVSKERVRQLEQRAVSKLRTMAADFELDDVFPRSVPKRRAIA